MVNISQEKPAQYYSAPRRAPRQQSSLCATAASHSLLSSSWGSTPAPSRFQSCGQVSGIPLPFQLPNKRSISISWLAVKLYLYKLIWDARCGEISCQWWPAQLPSRAPTYINPIVHEKGRGQELPLPNLTQISGKRRILPGHLHQLP